MNLFINLKGIKEDDLMIRIGHRIKYINKQSINFTYLFDTKKEGRYAFLDFTIYVVLCHQSKLLL